MILVLALLSLRRFFCLDLGLCIIAVDCVKRWKKWGEAGGEGRVRGGLPLNCDQNTIMMESDVYDCNPSSFTILLCDCQGSACDWCDCEKNWWITRELVDQQSQHVHWNRVKIAPIIVQLRG